LLRLEIRSVEEWHASVSSRYKSYQKKCMQLRAYDLFITDYKDKEGVQKEVVRIRSSIAFDESFIEECRKEGVRKYNFVGEEVEHVEDVE